MPTVPYFHIDAFADRPFTGNQAAVLVLESWPKDSVLQAIAAENNFAETAFLVPGDSGEADFELTWFTPTSAVDLCGHATLASGHVVLALLEPGRRKVQFRTRKAGMLEVSREGDGYALSLPAFPPEPAAFDEAVALLGAEPEEVTSHEGGYHIFRYADADAVRALDPDFRGLAKLGDLQFTCTAPGSDTLGTDTDVISRVFVPGAGVDEDSVTGLGPCCTDALLVRPARPRGIHRIPGQHARGAGPLPPRRRPRGARRPMRDGGKKAISPSEHVRSGVRRGLATGALQPPLALERLTPLLDHVGGIALRCLGLDLGFVLLARFVRGGHGAIGGEQYAQRPEQRVPAAGEDGLEARSEEHRGSIARLGLTARSRASGSHGSHSPRREIRTCPFRPLRHLSEKLNVRKRSGPSAQICPRPTKAGTRREKETRNDHAAHHKAGAYL